MLDQYRTKHEKLTFKRQIGQGSFGTVYLGELNGTAVAIKSVRSTKIDKKTIEDFRGEITASESAPCSDRGPISYCLIPMLGIVQVMAPLRHANLVCMLGACWDDGPDKLALILEYCPNGSLEDLLEIERQHSPHTWESPFYEIILGIVSANSSLRA